MKQFETVKIAVMHQKIATNDAKVVVAIDENDTCSNQQTMNREVAAQQ